jgi:hypothetical protein
MHHIINDKSSFARSHLVATPRKAAGGKILGCMDGFTNDRSHSLKALQMVSAVDFAAERGV